MVTPPGVLGEALEDGILFPGEAALGEDDLDVGILAPGDATLGVLDFGDFFSGVGAFCEAFLFVGDFFGVCFFGLSAFCCSVSNS